MADNFGAEPEVVEAITEEIKKLGDNTKANYEELRKRHEQLTKLVDEFGPEVKADIKEQMTKLTADISTRQEALDESIAEREKQEKVLEEALNKRVDSVEVAMQRLPGSLSGEVDNKSFVFDYDTKQMKSASPSEEACAFYTSALALSEDKRKDLAYVARMRSDPDMEGYRQYKAAFLKFVREPGDERSLPPEEFKALQVGKDPEGGYLVTPAIAARVITRIYESDPLRQLAQVESITTGALEWHVDWDEAGGGWEAETQAGAETATPGLGKKRIPVHVEYAKPKATQTLLEDSGINTESWLARHVARKFLRLEGAAFVTGDGVGKPRGFTTYSSGTTYGTVEQVAMQATATLTADGFIAVKYTLKEPFLDRGTWLMKRTTVASAMELKYGAGGYIWKPGFADDKISTILGLPVRMSTTMPTVAAGALSVALADWSEAYMIVDRLGITIQRDPYTRKPFVEFYTRKRVGGDVIDFDAIKIGKIATTV